MVYHGLSRGLENPRPQIHKQTNPMIILIYSIRATVRIWSLDKTCDVVFQGINQDVKSSDTVCETGDISMQDCQTIQNYQGNEI